jgi:GT2 family glycosyltransferase
MSGALTTVGIVNWNSGPLLAPCVESILRESDVSVLVFDNGSQDGSASFTPSASGRVQIVRDSRNRGFAGGVNEVFRRTDTPYVLILNPDVRVLPGTIQLMEEFMESHPRAAALGGYVGDKYPPRNIPTASSLVLDNLGLTPSVGALYERPGRSQTAPTVEVLRVEQVAAAAMLIRREPYKGTPMFDERFYPAWYEDVDFCRRLKHDDWEVYFAPHAKFDHSGGYSARTMGNPAFLYAYYRNQIRYAKKWFEWYEVVVVRASLVAGMIGRMVMRPWNAAGYCKVFFGALIGW